MADFQPLATAVKELYPKSADGILADIPAVMERIPQVNAVQEKVVEAIGGMWEEYGLGGDIEPINVAEIMRKEPGLTVPLPLSADRLNVYTILSDLNRLLKYCDEIKAEWTATELLNHTADLRDSITVSGSARGGSKPLLELLNEMCDTLLKHEKQHVADIVQRYNDQRHNLNPGRISFNEAEDFAEIYSQLTRAGNSAYDPAADIAGIRYKILDGLYRTLKNWHAEAESVICGSERVSMIEKQASVILEKLDAHGIPADYHYYHGFEKLRRWANKAGRL